MDTDCLQNLERAKASPPVAEDLLTSPLAWPEERPTYATYWRVPAHPKMSLTFSAARRSRGYSRLARRRLTFL